MLNLQSSSFRILYDICVIAGSYLGQKNSMFCVGFLFFSIVLWHVEQVIYLYANWRLIAHFVVAGQHCISLLIGPLLLYCSFPQPLPLLLIWSCSTSTSFIGWMLTAHNWQKWKRVFLKCPCHKIYRVEVVGLQRCNYTWKSMIFANMWNLGQFREKFICCQ